MKARCNLAVMYQKLFQKFLFTQVKIRWCNICPFCSVCFGTSYFPYIMKNNISEHYLVLNVAQYHEQHCCAHFNYRKLMILLLSSYLYSLYLTSIQCVCFYSLHIMNTGTCVLYKLKNWLCTFIFTDSLYLQIKFSFLWNTVSEFILLIVFSIYTNALEILTLHI
jgi:hypothetical protein